MRRLAALLLALALLSGCHVHTPSDDKLHILCTTYPVYLFTTAVTQGVDEVEVELLVNQQTSCLHDYTLTVEDMKAIDRSDIIVMNGAGLEEFLEDALEQKDVPVIDCSAGVDLLPALGHEGHDHEAEYDPHFWMSPFGAFQMLVSITLELSELLPEEETRFLENGDNAVNALDGIGNLPSGLKWITFHDGFAYFSYYWNMDLIKSIEEEEGSEASAQELKEIIKLVKENDIPAIFVEKNGSRRSADVIARETDCKVYELDMIMSGDGTGIDPYVRAMEQNLATIEEALG